MELIRNETENAVLSITMYGLTYVNSQRDGLHATQLHNNNKQLDLCSQ